MLARLLASRFRSRGTWDIENSSERASLRRKLREELAEAGALRDVTYERLDAAARGLQSGRRGRHFIKRGVNLEVEGS